MKKSNPYRTRLIVLLGFLAVVLIFFAVMLFHYQIIKGNSYRAQSMAGTARRETVETSRGIITDRNGKVLVSNRLTYTLKFSDESFDDDAACNAAREAGQTAALTVLLAANAPGSIPCR